MRSLVYFFPPRTSVTDSVGISTRPILSCSPKACTRDSRDSRTLRSNPEYEWMMYHFMLGLRGASGAPLPGALPAASGCPPAFFSSSAISCFISRTFCPARSAVPQGTEHEVDAAPDHKVDQPEIQAENKDRDDHHDRGGLHLFQRGRGHLLHLGADVVVEGLDLLRPGGDSPSQIVARLRSCHRLCHLLRLNSHAPHLLLIASKNWQGRRDSNPQVRFWRPAV